MLEENKEELENSEEQREGLKQDLSEANAKIIALEEELYESKTIQLELLENLKATEERLAELAAEQDGIHKQYADKLVFA
jgi:hypothetical protein